MMLYFLYLAVVILVGWYLLGDHITQKQRTICIAAVGLFWLVLFTCRYHIGYDYTSYLEIFEKTQALSLGEVFATYKVESGFYLLVKAIGTVGLPYHALLFVVNVIMLGCVFWTIYRYSSVWWLSASLYLLLQFVPYSMNMLRQALAVSILLAGWGFLKKGKWWQFMLVVLAASTMHMTVLIMIPAYFLLRLPYNPKVLLLYGGGTVVALLATDPLVALVTKFLPKYAIYVDHPIYALSGPISYIVLVPLLICGTALLMSKLLLKRDPDNRILIYASVFGAAISLLYLRMYILERFSVYFMIFLLLLLPEMVAALKLHNESLPKATRDKMKKQKQIPEYVLMTAAILCVMFYYWGMGVRGGTHKAYPYVGIWATQEAVPNQEYYEDHI